MAQFELLDTLLKENGEKPLYTKDGVKPVVEGEEVVTENEKNEEIVTEDAGDAVIYAELDSLVESAMRENLRQAVLESDFDSDIKLSHLNLVESASFTDEQILTFMHEKIDPVMTIWEESTKDLDGSVEWKSASIIVMELANLLTALKEDTLLESDDDKSLYETIITAGDTKPTNEDVMVTELAEIIKDYDLDEETFNVMFEQAKELVKTDVTIVPSILELTSLVEMDEKDDDDDDKDEKKEDDKDEKKEDDDDKKEDLKEAKMGVIKGLGRMIKPKGQGAARAASRKAGRKAVGSAIKANKGKYAAGAGAATVATAAMVAKKSRGNDKVSEGIEAALKIAASQLYITDDSKYQKAIMKEIAKWEARLEK